MSIGEDLAAARRRAGLTVTQVSQRTCIRETIICGIERDDYSACGGDFYARGHIRAIARAVGANPGPLIGEYDAAHPAQAVTAADLFQPVMPVRPVRPRQRRRVSWVAVLGLALVVALGVAAYHVITISRRTPAAASGATAGLHQAIHRHPRHATPSPAAAIGTAPAPHTHKIAIHLTAIEDCWVGFTTPGGRYVFQSYVVAGTSRRWAFGHAVDMRLGNPGGIKLTVDGKNPLPPGTASPITLRLGLHGKVSS